MPLQTTLIPESHISGCLFNTEQKCVSLFKSVQADNDGCMAPFKVGKRCGGSSYTRYSRQLKDLLACKSTLANLPHTVSIITMGG